MRKQDKNIAHLFKNVITMSGTPDWVQREMTAKNRKNECKCSPKLAMENGWICKPVLNLVNCSDADWPAAVKAVFYRELKTYESNGKLFKPTILVNCKSIDDVANLREVPWFKDNVGKLFHLISIHSRKTVHDNSGTVRDLCAEIDGKAVEAEEAYNAISNIDKQEDNLPVVVFQVQMIGEGINVKSFNAVVTASNCDKTAMQQIGRVLRNFYVKKTVVEKHEEKLDGFFNKLFKKTKVVETQVEKTFSKVDDGTANVYVINDNLRTLTNLIVGLSNYDLTSSCFSWGDKLDINEGSSPGVLDEEDSAKLQKPSWNALDAVSPEIIEVLNTAKKKVLTACFDSFFDELEDNDGNGIPDAEEFKSLIEKKKSEGMVEVWAGKATRDDPKEMMLRFRDWIMKQLDNDVFKLLWRKDRKSAFLYVVQDAEMAEFLNSHLSEKIIDSFGD